MAFQNIVNGYAVNMASMYVSQLSTEAEAIANSYSATEEAEAIAQQIMEVMQSGMASIISAKAEALANMALASNATEAVAGMDMVKASIMEAYAKASQVLHGAMYAVNLPAADSAEAVEATESVATLKEYVATFGDSFGADSISTNEVLSVIESASQESYHSAVKRGYTEAEAVAVQRYVYNRLVAFSFEDHFYGMTAEAIKYTLRLEAVALTEEAEANTVWEA